MSPAVRQLTIDAQACERRARVARECGRFGVAEVLSARAVRLRVKAARAAGIRPGRVTYVSDCR